MSVEFLTFNHKYDIRKFRLIKHRRKTWVKSNFYRLLIWILSWFGIKVWAWVGVKHVDVLEVILSIWPTNYVQFTIHKSHRMPSSSFWILRLFTVFEVVAVLPSRINWIKRVKIVKAKCVRTRATEEEKFIVDIAKLHSCSWCRWLSNNLHLAPDLFPEREDEEIVKSFGSIPASENVEIVLDNGRAMIRSGRWSHSTGFLDVSPVQGCGI